MKHIVKGVADYHLEKKNQNPPTTHTEATTAWGRFKHKEPTRDRCFTEQCGLCGYSETDLNESGIGMHLEHVVPKNFNPLLTFEHSNLILSAFDCDHLSGLDKRDVFGGHHKLSWYNAEAFIHPFLNNCCDYFHYEITGRVVPKAVLPIRERAKARLTIYRLNLNAPILVNQRRIWLEETDDIIADLLDDIDALRSFAEIELLPVARKMRPFHSAVKQLFGKLGEEVIQDYFTR